MSISKSSSIAFKTEDGATTTVTTTSQEDSDGDSVISRIIKQYSQRVQWQLALEDGLVPNRFISFTEKGVEEKEPEWLADNTERFFKNSPNTFLAEVNFLSQMGYITAMCYSPDGTYIVVGYSSGLIQARDGFNGEILATVRNIQFPPKAIYAIVHSRTEERIAYAACTDGVVYKFTIPLIDSIFSEPKQCIQSDPALIHIAKQYYSPGTSSTAVPFNSQRTPALSLGITSDDTKIAVGYADTSVRIYDMTTAETLQTFKMHKKRLMMMNKKLKRMHSGQVCALATHNEDPNVIATAAWDQTLRVWDPRVAMGCVMTFEGVDVVGNSIDFCREQLVVGSWQPIEALTVWDMIGQKKRCIVRVQNRRPDVDGEYIYACQFWKSPAYNRKGKYGIIGGSGTSCVEVINLHNRYITCSYPHKGSVVALTSYYDRIAFGGTATKFYIVTFHDPKHETYHKEKYEPLEYNKGDVDFGSDDDVVSKPSVLNLSGDQ